MRRLLKTISIAIVLMASSAGFVSCINNRMMTFEAETREMWQDICKSHGLEIETEPRPRRKHLDKADYIAEQKQAEIETFWTKRLGPLKSKSLCSTRSETVWEL